MEFDSEIVIFNNVFETICNPSERLNVFSVNVIDLLTQGINYLHGTNKLKTTICRSVDREAMN